TGFFGGRSTTTTQIMTPKADRAAAKIQGSRIIASSSVRYQRPDQIEQRLVLRTVRTFAQKFANFSVGRPSSRADIRLMLHDWRVGSRMTRQKPDVAVAALVQN